MATKKLSPKNKRIEALGSKNDIYSTTKAREEKIVSSEEEKKRIIKQLKNISQRNTSLTVAPKCKKPIAYLDQLAPFVKVVLRLPKVNTGNQTFRNVEYDNIDLFYKTDKDGATYFNNFIKGFEYSHDGKEGSKCILSISDISFDFTDMLLLRFRALDDTNLTFMDVTFGWTTPDMKTKADGVIFQNTVTFSVQDISEDDSQFEREIKISGTVINTFPDAASLITPYSILGPYPLITYNFIKYLYSPFQVQLDLMGLIGGDPKKNIPKVGMNDIKEKIEFVKNLYQSNLMLGKGDPLKGTKSAKLWLQDIFGKKEAAGMDPSRVFVATPFSANPENNQIYNQLKSIFDPNKKSTVFIDGKKKEIGPTLNSSMITQIYNSEVFFSTIKGRGKNTYDGPGNSINYLVSKVAPLLKEVRIHPWEAARYFYYSMIEIIIGVGGKPKTNVAPPPEYDFIELDFAGVINYSGTDSTTKNAKNVGRVDKTELLIKSINPTNKILGYTNLVENQDLMQTQKSPYIKVFGIPSDSIRLSQGTSWEQLLSQAFSHVKVNIEELLGKKEFEDFKKATKPTIIQKKLKGNKDGFLQEENTIFVKEMGSKSNAAFRFATLQCKLFFATKISRDAILNTIDEMLKIKAITRIKKADDTIIANKGEVGEKISTSFATKSDGATVDEETLRDLAKKIRETSKTPGSMIMTLNLDKAGSIFHESFGENNIAQAYSVRFKNSTNGFNSANKGGSAIGLEFPDVVTFKPQIKNLLDHVRHTLPLTDMFEVNKEWANKKVSSTYTKQYDTDKANLDEDKRKLKEDTNKAKTADEIKEIEKRTSEIVKRENALGKQFSDSQKITVINNAEEIEKIESDRLRKWNERARFPISWNSDPRTGSNFLDGNLDADSAMMKTAVTNLKRRMIIHSMSYDAELRIIGDPTFAGVFPQEKLLYIKVLMADGRDSIHTGIYQINGYSHSVSAGSYFTTFRLTKRPDLNSGDNPQLMTQMISSLASDPLYKTERSAEDVFTYAAASGDEKKRLYQEDKKKMNGTETKVTAEQARARINAALGQPTIERKKQSQADRFRENLF